MGVGCGHGVLVSLLAEQLATGLLVGVDRSATMIATAARRNEAAVQEGRVRLLAAPLLDADLDGSAFDVVARVLAPTGRVLVAFSVMGGDVPDAVVEGLRRPAGEQGLAVTAVHHGATHPYPSAAVELRRG